LLEGHLSNARNAVRANVHGEITEIELQIIQIDQDLRSEVTMELREIQDRWPSCRRAPGVRCA